MNSTDPLHEFRRSLAAGIAWCDDHPEASDASQRFRTPELRPPIDIGEHTDSLDLVRNAVQHVIDHRYMYCDPDRGANSPADLSGGRLLAFYPQITLFDGFAAIESDGFFDPANVPPWDTWIYVIDDFLISFVPKQFIIDVECGLITNVEECIVWLSDVDHPFVRQLQNHKLVA